MQLFSMYKLFANAAQSPFQNLHDPSIFISTNLTSLRQLISQTSPIHTWAPLKSFRRIIVSFYDTDSAIAIKQALDGQTVMGERVRVYFGEPTPLAEPLHKHLQAPRSDKMFFISPPPSPPHGWQMRDEDPPNKEVHAEDLASALARLHARHDPLSPEDVSLTKPGSDVDADTPQRTRSGSYSIVYQPDADGNSPGLPAIAVEDLTDSSAPISPMDVSVDKKFVHTSRPPLELNSDV